MSDGMFKAQVTDQQEQEAQLYCPYCGKELADLQAACCGEVGHGTTEKTDEPEKK